MTITKLNIGVHYEPSGVDPHIGSAELALQMTNAVFDTLVNRTPDGDYLPGLADTFEISTDECTYTFKLRRDVKFHDGEPFNAAAAAFSLERAFDPANKSQLARAMLGPFKNATALDDYTLCVELTRPYGLLLDALSQGWLAPVSPAAVESLGADFARAPVGTGPFIFERWNAGETITLKRNPAYNWGPPLVDNKGPAHFDELVFTFLSDGEERAQALENNSVDAVFYVPPDAAQRLRDDPRYYVETWPIRGVPVSLMMNIKRAPTDDIKVRQAINYAIDQDALVEEVFHDEFERSYGPVSQFTLGFSPEVKNKYDFDPVKAQKLLDEAGWRANQSTGMREKDGVSLSVSFYALPVNFYPEFGKIVTRQLGDVGVHVEVCLLNPQDWIKAGMKGDHHLIPQGKYGSSAQLLSFVYHSRHSGPAGYGWSKREADHAPGFDALLEKAEAAIAPADYIPLYKQAQEIVMDEALIAPLHCNTNIVAARNGVQGVKFDAIGAYPLVHDITIDDPAKTSAQGNS
ncbi:ABC transporter substrate-binding protein [Hyphococcus sp.]|uniref:ABC transporter substrate-binding protein n=1 Tax=Hyphococcus sp. TaxID=2038636 RepID=UPI003CCC2D07